MAQIVLLLFGSVLLALSLSVQGVFNWLYKKPMDAVFPQAYGPPTKILLLPLVTNMISATSV